MIRKQREKAVEERPNMRGGAGTVTVRHLFKPAEFTAKCRLCAVLTLPPGASIGVHQHTGEDEVYLVTEGSGILDDGTTQTRLAEGDAVLTGKGGSHAIANDGTRDLKIAAVILCYGTPG